MHFLHLRYWILDLNEEKKNEIRLSPMTKILYTHININTKRHHNFDYTTIADRLRTVTWSNDSNPTDLVKPVNGIPAFHGEWEGGSVNQVNHTNRMDVVCCHLVDRPQSVPQLSCNRTLQFSKTFRLNKNAIFHCLVIQFYHFKPL